MTVSRDLDGLFPFGNFWSSVFNLPKLKLSHFPILQFTWQINKLWQQPAAAGSWKPLSRTGKMEMIDAQKAGKGCKKTAKCFQGPISSVGNVIKKWQVPGTVMKGTKWDSKPDRSDGFSVYVTKVHLKQAVKKQAVISRTTDRIRIVTQTKPKISNKAG